METELESRQRGELEAHIDGGGAEQPARCRAQAVGASRLQLKLETFLEPVWKIPICTKFSELFRKLQLELDGKKSNGGRV